MTEATLLLNPINTGRYGAWSARIQRGFHSDVRALALLIHALDVGPSRRPVVRWSPLLLTVALLGAGLGFLDGVFTALALMDSSHPFVTEVWGPTSKILEVAGIPGLLVSKLFQALFLFFMFDLARLRGLRKSVWALSLVCSIIGGLLVANSISIILSPPTLLY